MTEKYVTPQRLPHYLEEIGKLSYTSIKPTGYGGTFLNVVNQEGEEYALRVRADPLLVGSMVLSHPRSEYRRMGMQSE